MVYLSEGLSRGRVGAEFLGVCSLSNLFGATVRGGSPNLEKLPFAEAALLKSGLATSYLLPAEPFWFACTLQSAVLDFFGSRKGPFLYLKSFLIIHDLLPF